MFAKKCSFFCWLALLVLLVAAPASAAPGDEIPTAEPFVGKIVLEGLEAPWGMIWEPGGHLWITERQGKRVLDVDPASGQKTVLLEISEIKTGPQHEGLLGLALAPDFKNSGLVYLNYTYMDGDKEKHKIVRYKYDPKAKKLGNPEDILVGIPAGSDHQGGRLIFGPDGKLYLSKGELGHNQGGHRCKPNDAQRTPTAEEVAKKDYSAYVGKVLRLNPDGGVPADNPVIKGVKSHVFTLGHRNPQGLLFIGDQLFSVEQGPSTDDELNRLEPGGNYGWPLIAGYQDDQAYGFIDWSKVPGCEKTAGDVYLPSDQPIEKETKWDRKDFKEPARTFYTVPSSYNFKDPKFGALAYLGWATIAPSSLDYYPPDGPIKAWQNSIIISALKNGAIYRLPLSGDVKQVQGDILKYFHTQNRYRQVLLSLDGRSIYVITDSSGNVLDENGLPAQTLKNPGSLIVFEYRRYSYYSVDFSQLQKSSICQVISRSYVVQ
ncbi:MAG: PQQ-dependent sugar dehydrogenase [Deltaproteobacteria bacterium]|jgi:PQQ-dependent dehydrogenase (s-GDH family)|nr:PQQ-dependent sugar dehydrogenase [Deltaproteobacteria bacterium]